MLRLAPVLLAIACTPGADAPQDSAEPIVDTADTGARPTTDPGWTLGTPQACDAPVDLGWVDVSDRLEAGPLPRGRFENGGLAVLPDDDGWRITASMGLQALKTWSPDGSVTVWDRGVPTSQFNVLDLDEDGTPDLVPLAGDLTIQADWTGAGADPLTLMELDDDVRYRDVSTVDLDGDGVRELVLSLWDGRWGGLEIWDRSGGTWALRGRLGEDNDGVGQAFDHVIADFTGDDVPDVYLCNDHGPDFGANRLLVNDGAGGFTDETPAGADLAMSCMSVSAGDLDGDGRLDVAMSGSFTSALLLAGDDAWVNVATAWGAPVPVEESMGWGTALADLDNDGLTDMLMARSGFSSVDDGTSRPDVLHQSSRGVLTAADWGLAPAGGSRNVAVLDLNGDGVQDVVWSFLDGGPAVFESTGCTAAAWLEVSGPEGSIVRVEAGGRTQAALVTSQPGFSTTVPAVAHIGLGETAAIDRVTLDVPWRGRVTLEGPIPPRQRLTWAPPDER